MRRRLVLFAADVNRYGPLAVVSLATAVCLPSIRSYLAKALPVTTVLERYALSLLLAMLAVRFVSRLVVRYAARNVPDPGAAPDDTDVARGPSRG